MTHRSSKRETHTKTICDPCKKLFVMFKADGFIFDITAPIILRTEFT
jgi:hypothetical protein